MTRRNTLIARLIFTATLLLLAATTPIISAWRVAAAKALFSLVVRSLVFICRASTALLPLFEISRQ